MSCDYSRHSPDSDEERKTLRIALALNATMSVIGISAGLWAQSTGLMADALDMLADALAYLLPSMAITRDADFKRILLD